MPNLVGIGLSQVPTNSMLGGLAYQSPDHASIKDLDLKNLSQINSEIADTAVDIFVYDTSKDSDGGAWRKRTQHTSWYNETLNTATRGSRKEFPAVAVIVSESDTLTIYDGDDPDLPMWMVFNTTSGTMLRSGVITSISMLNAELCVCHTSGSGFHRIWFLKDTARWLTASTGYGGYYGFASNSGGTTIAERNTAGGNYLNNISGASDIVIVSSNCNDVAMTVLPNAPIDSTSGLPVPTIAVATDGGVSVIKDDGTVVDILNGNPDFSYPVKIDFTGNTKDLLYWVYGYRAITDDTHAVLIDIPSSDFTTSSSHTNSINSTYNSTLSSPPFILPYPNAGSTLGNVRTSSSKTNLFAGNITGLSNLLLNNNSEANSMVAYATTSYNTGWMYGDIKGAFLSGISTASVTYSTVADDWATAGAWTKQSSITLTSTGSGTSGTVTITGNGTGSNVYFFNPITVEANTDYVVTVTFGAYNANAFHINNTQYSTSGSKLNIGSLSGLTRGGHFNSGSDTTLYIQGWQQSTTATTITNIVIQKVSERDRSVNNKGLAVFGTITKSAVATGSELVAYSGFSGSNYLLQPYNSDLDVGTGDISVIGWFKSSNSNGGYLFERMDPARTGNRLRGYVTSTQLQFLISTSAGLAIATSSSYTDGNWHFYSGVKRGSVMYLYADGVLLGSSDVGTNSVTNTSANLSFGIRSDATSHFQGGNMALWRVSASAPSPEQVKKMYEDEKVLFQENAKATLYGSSDAVTALAYDEVTDRLHVGTSSGRSDFQGLRRINNTTTAVTTAISAHDEFIVEQ